MACNDCGASCQGALCSQCELARSHEGVEAEDLGWNRAKAVEEEREADSDV